MAQLLSPDEGEGVQVGVDPTHVTHAPACSSPAMSASLVPMEVGAVSVGSVLPTTPAATMGGAGPGVTWRASDGADTGVGSSRASIGGGESSGVPGRVTPPPNTLTHTTPRLPPLHRIAIVF